MALSLLFHQRTNTVTRVLHQATKLAGLNESFGNIPSQMKDVPRPCTSTAKLAVEVDGRRRRTSGFRLRLLPLTCGCDVCAAELSSHIILSTTSCHIPKLSHANCFCEIGGSISIQSRVRSISNRNQIHRFCSHPIIFVLFPNGHCWPVQRGSGVSH